MKDITLGQYYETNSIIHRLDPRVKLFATMIYIISLFLIDGFFGFLIAFVTIYGIARIAKIPFGMLMKGLKGILMILIISVIFNLFLTDGQVLVKIGFLKITVEGIKRAVFIGVRLALLIIGTSMMTLTTTPNDLADGLEKAFHFLSKIGVPVHEIAMMMSIALRFIPILMEETEKIMNAQKSRGADFETKGLINKAKAMLPLLVPLFISSIRRAVDLASAMEARCYRGGKGRTKMKPLHYQKRDKMGYVMCLGFLVVLLLSDHLLYLIPGIGIFYL